MSNPILLDTNAFIWAVEGDKRLGVNSRNLVDVALREENVSVSAISFWEIALLISRSRLGLAYPSNQWRQNALRLGIVEAPVTGDIAIQSVELTGFHRDPTDRIIAATAIIRGATLMTADERILSWNGNLRCQDARR